MKKLLFSLILLLCLGVTGWGQTPNGNLTFGTTANSTTATTANTGFGGIRIGTGGGSFTIMNTGQEIGTDAELRGIAPTGGSINSVGITSTEFGSSATTFTVSFEVYFSGGSSGTWYFFAGNGAGFAAAQSATFTGAQVFTGLRWVFGATSTITTNNRAAGAWNATGITGTPIAQAVSYTVSIVGNNSAALVNYGASQSVAANKYDLWVNGVLVGDELDKAQLPATTAINAFRFYSESSAGNVANIALDNIRWWNSCVAPSMSIYSAITSLPANTYTDLDVNGGNASVAGNVTVSRDMTLSSGSLTVGSGNQLSVSGNLTNNSSNGIVLQSPANSGAPGSLIVSGSISGSGTLKLERYVAAYTGATDGWHLLSSPVNNFTIAGSTFEPGSVDPNIDDLYWYDEATNFWKNYKVGGNFSSFTNGYGYLCSYQTAATKYFTGTPNNADITFSDLTLTSSRGWHAIGNPFQSALKWNDGNWTLTNVNTTAKLLNSGGTYSNLVANDIIPAAQGVFVQVTDATNTITIPKAARTHNTAIWNKSGNEILARLRFTATSETDNTYVETDFLFDSQASNSVDEGNDGFFLQGIETAPQMFLKLDNQNLSLKRLPSFNGVYSLQFIKGLSSSYSFSLSGMESLPENIIVTLKDTKTNQSQVLTENPVYSFTSEVSDLADRFLIVFGVVGIGENNPDQSLQAYISGNNLYVISTNESATLQLFDLQGRLVQASQLNGEGLQSQPLYLPAGVYIVRVQNEKAVKSARVVVSE